MKLISDKDASIAKGKANFDTYYWNDYGITATEDFIRQAQLESCEKEHKAEIRGIKEAIEGNWLIDRSGTIPSWWQDFWQKRGVK